MGGVSGSFRFWPAGYWNVVQRRQRAKTEIAEAALCDSTIQAPSLGSWCALGGCFPRGTHLFVRFSVGEERSPGQREVFWDGGTGACQVWGPTTKEPPPGAISDGCLVVSLEIFRNVDLHQDNPYPRRFHKQLHKTKRALSPLGDKARRGENAFATLGDMDFSMDVDSRVIRAYTKPVLASTVKSEKDDATAAYQAMHHFNRRSRKDGVTSSLAGGRGTIADRSLSPNATLNLTPEVGSVNSVNFAT